MIDQHVHSRCSHDGISTIKEHISYAKDHGIDEITFTEHYDDYTGLITNLKPLDINKYIKEYEESEVNGFVGINLGIEIGLRPESYDKIKAVVVDVEKGEKGSPQVIVSRSHPDFVRKLLEFEIPEISLL